MEITREFTESGPASMTNLAQFSERCEAAGVVRIECVRDPNGGWRVFFESPTVRSETRTSTLGYALCRGLENAEFNADFDTE